MKAMQKVATLVALMSACAACAEVFHDGDTVVFFGDSITHAGFYHEYIADYYLTRFPDASIRFVNSGVGGDNAAAATNRVEVDVAEYRPTHVALHFGMNDVGRGSYSATPSAHQLEAIETAQEKFRRNFPALVGKVKEAVPEAKAIYLTPTPYDDTAVPTNIPPGTTGWATKNNKGCNTGLSLLAGYILVSAKRDGVFAVDWFTPLNNFLMRRRSDDPHFMVTNWDRVHPGALGHAIMAWQFLISQGAPAVVSDVCVDAAKGIVARSDNATVSDVKVADDSVSFTVHAKSLPFPVPPEAAEAIDEFKVEERLNRETLAVEGLREGDYTLLIDGEEVGAWSAAELARGIRLGFNAKTPQYRQARAVFDRNAELSARERTFRDYHASRWFYGKRAPVDDMEAFGKWYEENVKDKKMYYAQFVPGYLKYWPTHKEARAKLWADQEAVRTLAKPVPRRYEIRQSCWPVVLPEKYARDPGAGFALVFVTDLVEPTAALRAFTDDYQDAVFVCAKGADRDRLLADVCGRYRVFRFPRGRIDLTSSDLAKSDAKASLANYFQWGRYQAETPELTRCGARLYRKDRRSGAAPEVRLPSPWRLVEGDDGATGCDSRLYYFTIEADGKALPPPVVSVSWPGVAISSVDGAKNVSYTKDGVVLTPTARSGGANYVTMIREGSIALALYHHVEGAQHGFYGGQPLPWAKIRASDNWRAACREIFHLAGLADTNATDGASIRLYGFDSNFPNRHVDHPEHFHVMLEWDNWKKNNVGHYTLDEKGFIRGNNFLVCGDIGGGLPSGYHLQKPGETTSYVGPSGRSILTLEMLPGGKGLVLRRPGSPDEWRVWSEAPVDGVAIAYRKNTADRWQEIASVSVTDDTEAGEMDFVFRSAAGEILGRRHVHYCRDTGRLISCSGFDFALLDRVGGGSLKERP